MQKGKSKDPNNEEPRRSTRFPGISQLLRSPMDHYSDHSRASVVDFPSKKIQDASQVQRLLSVPDTDGDELLQLLCRRSTEQRMEINCEFKKLFESDISAEIKRAIPKDSELRRLLLFLVTPNDEYLAQELWDALCDAKNVDLRTIIGIMGTHKWQDLQKIRCAYFRRFQRSLEKVGNLVNVQQERSYRIRCIINGSVIETGRCELRPLPSCAFDEAVTKISRAKVIFLVVVVVVVNLPSSR